MSEPTLPTSNQCGVKGCKNTRDSGAFVGPFCAPCDHDLRTGNFEFGTSVVYGQAREIERLRAAAQALADRMPKRAEALAHFHAAAEVNALRRVLSGNSSAPETKTVPLSTYESAVRGRQEFRKAYIGALKLMKKFVDAWEGVPGHENMDRLCEMARNFSGGSVEETSATCVCGCYSGGCGRPEGCRCDRNCPCGSAGKEATPRGKPCTCDNCLGSSTSCRVDAGERLGDLWYCRKRAENGKGDVHD